MYSGVMLVYSWVVVAVYSVVVVVYSGMMLVYSRVVVAVYSGVVVYDALGADWTRGGSCLVSL